MGLSEEGQELGQDVLNFKLQFILILLLIRAPPSVTVGAYKLQSACSS